MNKGKIDTKRKEDEMKNENVKLSIYIAKDTDEKFRRYTQMLGLTKSAFGNMCILIGISNYARMLEPEKMFSELDWLNLMKAVNVSNEELARLVREGKKSR